MGRVTMRRFQRDGEIADPIAPHYALPAQMPPRNLQLTPEQRMLAAMLEDAVRDLRKFAQVDSPRGRERYWETVAWFCADTQPPPYFAFPVVCEALNLNVAAVRRELRVAEWAPAWVFARERYAGFAGGKKIRGTKMRHVRAA